MGLLAGGSLGRAGPRAISRAERTSACVPACSVHSVQGYRQSPTKQTGMSLPAEDLLIGEYVRRRVRDVELIPGDCARDIDLLVDIALHAFGGARRRAASRAPEHSGRAAAARRGSSGRWECSRWRCAKRSRVIANRPQEKLWRALAHQSAALDTSCPLFDSRERLTSTRTTPSHACGSADSTKEENYGDAERLEFEVM